jgi:hypothetical protein
LQRKSFTKLIKEAKQTQFGIDHHFDQIKMRRILPTKFHSGLIKPYVDKVVQGQKISYGRKTALFC